MNHPEPITCTRCDARGTVEDYLTDHATDTVECVVCDGTGVENHAEITAAGFNPLTLEPDDEFCERIKHAYATGAPVSPDEFKSWGKVSHRIRIRSMALLGRV